ncbi:MAG: alpha-L-fucosidase [Candidatus Aminicenantes bacterium]|nr:alpha-L-fucosidase [Candidatus Aminicenantes bacterium]
MKIRNKWKIGILLVLAGTTLLLLTACSPGPDKSAAAAVKPVTLIPEDKVRLSNDPAKTEIFRDAGLGLFIHWGPNSQLGTEISWPLNGASDDYVKRYYALAETFNPTAFDAAEWARLAKLAGIEYVCFTAKHHDGYAMFDTAYSDFKITKSPYGKDITAAVADAFRKEGILVGIYYSPGDFRYQFVTGKRFTHLYEADFTAGALFGPKQTTFLDYERGQIEELLTKYGDIFMIWFDGKCEPLKKRSWQVKQDVFIGRGEIPTPEQEIPGQADDRAWESCMTTSWQWAYQPNADVRTADEVIRNLIHIRARGGNMLLNVGPRPDGKIAPPDEALLRELGLWMSLYGEGVRGVRPWITTNEGDVWLTTRRSDGTVYAFVGLQYGLKGIKTPGGARFTLKSVKAGTGTQVSVLSQDGGVEWNEDKQGLHVTVSQTHSVQLIKTPAAMAKALGAKAPSMTWGPAWPIVVKITNATAGSVPAKKPVAKKK